MSNNTSVQSATGKRTAHPDFVSTFSVRALQDRLPLCFPVPEGVPRSPKRRYRSAYRYLGYDDLLDPSRLASLTFFEVALRLIDFSPLRNYLAQCYYVQSAKGQTPFDPVSLFLGVCLRRQLNIGWRKLAKLIAGEHGSGWRRLFGFQDQETPSASGLRYFFNTVGSNLFAELCSLFTDLLHKAGLLPQHTTFAGDPPQRGVTISHDIMLHHARSNMRCYKVTETCYQPAPRPCPAKEAGKKGCDCASHACAKACQRTTPADPQARYIYYAGRNKKGDLPPAQGEQAEGTSHGQHFFGYASNPDRIIDDRFACAWTIRTDLHPANVDERSIFPSSFAHLLLRFPYLKIGEVLADAALGYQCCLDPIWDAGALRMVDIRAAQCDDDTLIQRRRGYDQNGHPLCIHGYKMRSNGHDYQRRRTKWCCAHACLSTQTDEDQQTPPRPAPDCPFQAPEHKHGLVINVARTLPDGSLRLAREVPYDSPSWKKRYGRRNLSESRNGLQEQMGLKRLPGFGLPRGFRETVIGDLLESLRTLGRLVCEATSLALKRSVA
ncbi:MAG: hypothetical protein ACYST6_16930 [Planctomycetota bacterium]|jgi:hypothetical protein